MKAQAIERYSTADEITMQLRQEASQLLGYQKKAGSLLKTLKSLGITPLLDHKVARYKQSKEKVGLYSGTRTMLWWCASVVLSIAVWTWLLSTSSKETFNDFNPHSFFCWALGVYGVVGSVVVTVMRMFNEVWGQGKRYNRSWNVVALNGFSRVVPDFALSKAVEIKKAVPEAWFGVEELVETHEEYYHPRPTPDPFLFVSIGQEKFYLDVWDEKDFEKTI